MHILGKTFQNLLECCFAKNNGLNNVLKNFRIALSLCPLGETVFPGCGTNPTKKIQVCV